MLIGELIATFISWNSRHRAPATVGFYRTRLKKFCRAYNARELASLTPLEVDEHLATAGTGMSDSTRHHDVVDLQRLQKFAIEHKLLDEPVFGNLEKPRVGRRDRVPTAAETEAILAKASPAFRLIYSALRQCGARPGELCRATIADVDRANCVITLKEHKTVRKTGQPRRIPIGRKLGELLTQAIGDRQAGPIFLSPAGKAWSVPNLSRSYSRLRNLAGLPRDLVLYLARHECGTKICREKGIEYARRLLGHATTFSHNAFLRRGVRPESFMESEAIQYLELQAILESLSRPRVNIYVGHGPRGL
jgi:integrase